MSLTVTTREVIAIAIVIALTVTGVYMLVRHILAQRAALARARAERTRSEILGWRDEVERTEEIRSDDEAWDQFRKNYPPRRH